MYSTNDIVITKPKIKPKIEYMGYSNMGNSPQDLLKGCLPLAMFLSFVGFIVGNIQEEN